MHSPTGRAHSLWTIPVWHLEIVGRGPEAPDIELHARLLEEPAVSHAERGGDRVLVSVEADDVRDASAIVAAVLYNKVTASVRDHFLSVTGVPRIRAR